MNYILEYWQQIESGKVIVSARVRKQYKKLAERIKKPEGRYIFDENHDAVQHRILYMYNPLLVASEFHESQNYILTYEDVRFFDRWGY